MNLNTNFVKHSVGIFTRYIKKRFDDGPNPNHYDEEGNDYRGFNLDGIHKVTGTTRDESGFDEWGIDLEGYNLEGYDNRGFNRKGIHCITKTRFNSSGYDADVCDKDGFHWYTGVHKVTGKLYDESGYDRRGFNENRIHKNTGTHLDERNNDADGKYGLVIHCPQCNGTSASVVIWGLPGDPRKRRTDSGEKIIYGGCCLPTKSEPNRICDDCGHGWRHIYK